MDDEPFGHLPESDDEPFGHLPDGDDELNDTDDDARAVGSVLPVAPPLTANRIPSKYRKSAGASVLAAGLLGLRDIIDPPKDDRPVVEQHTNDDDVERAMELYLDPDDPSKSMVVIRDPHDAN